MTNQNNILTEEEIKELIGNLNRNPSETEIRAVYRLLSISPFYFCIKALRRQRV